MSLTCPRCVGTLTDVKISTHYGGYVMVSQCQQCGGMWFDPFEYSQIKSSEIEKLDDSNNLITAQPTDASAVLNCPKDSSVLIRFSDITIPKELNIERCAVCGGYWFDKGELRQWSDAAKTKKQFVAANKIDFSSFLPKNNASNINDAISKVSGILLTPMNGSRAMSDDPSTQLVVNYASLAFNTIMRSMLKSI